MLQKFATLLNDADNVVVFSGAGASTESGLSDFRSKDSGLWEKFNPQELATIDALRNNKDQFVEFYQFRLKAILEAGPHEGHYILSDWEKSGFLHSIITQNVDGFHYMAGSSKVRELHGSFSSFHCHDCLKQYNGEHFLIEATCSCGGTIRPNIVLFGEGLPEEAFRLAEKESVEADLFIVLGSSLTVSPANMFPLIAKENGAKLIIVNRDETPYNHLADLVIQDLSIKNTLTQVDQLLKK